MKVKLSVSLKNHQTILASMLQDPIHSSFLDTTLVCEDGHLRVNRLLLALLPVPPMFLGEQPLLLMPMHDLGEVQRLLGFGEKGACYTMSPFEDNFEKIENEPFENILEERTHSYNSMTVNKMTTLPNQHFTERDLEYLDSKDQDTLMVRRDRKTGIINTSLVVIPPDTLASYFSTLASTREVPEIPCRITEQERDKLPDTPGPIRDIFKSKSRTQSFAAELMKFWRGTLGKVRTGCGEFAAWNNVRIHVAEFPFCQQMLGRVVDDLPGGFQVCMADILEWSDLQGVHSIASGKPKSLKCKWQWLEWLKFFIVWTYRVCGKNIENCVNSSWKESNND